MWNHRHHTCIHPVTTCRCAIYSRSSPRKMASRELCVWPTTVATGAQETTNSTTRCNFRAQFYWQLCCTITRLKLYFEIPQQPVCEKVFSKHLSRMSRCFLSDATFLVGFFHYFMWSLGQSFTQTHTESEPYEMEMLLQSNTWFFSSLMTV